MVAVPLFSLLVAVPLFSLFVPLFSLFRHILAPTKHNIAPYGKGSRIHRSRRVGSRGIVMNPHLAEVMAESGLEEGTDGIGQGLSATFHSAYFCFDIWRHVAKLVWIGLRLYSLLLLSLDLSLQMRAHGS
jgi:hypothetical protein